MKRFLPKALRWTAIVLATLAVLLLVLYAEEDWRGARDWASCQRDLAAKGETLDLRQLVPPGNPADDLSKVPIFAEMYWAYQHPGKGASNPRIQKIDIGFNPGYPSLRPKGANYFNGESIDLAAWQKFYRSIPETHLPDQIDTPARDVLKTLSQFDPELNEIDAAVSNPNAYWPIDYEKPFDAYLGGITAMIHVASALPLKAVAHLENRETDLAEKDYMFSFRLNQSLSNGCSPINYFVVMGVRTIDDAILWEGLRRHAWSDNQLHEMETALASIDMLDLATKSFRMERATLLQSIKVTQHMKFDSSKEMEVSFNDGWVFAFKTRMIRPAGWWDQDRTTYSQGMQKVIDAINLKNKTLRPSAFPFHDTNEYEMGGEHLARDISIWSAICVPISSEALPFIENMGSKIARAETYRRLARLACRLEEYRIAHGAYPDKLDDLPDLPAHLNQEVLSVQPLQYHRKGDGYQLYSLGWNQKDDGGAYNADPKAGDWPWPSP